jgi:DNA-binding NtrC family response regulator
MEGSMAARILILDDEALLLESLRRTLRAHRFPSEGTRSPETALARLKQQPYEVLITDFRMPGLDGIEVLQRARRIRPACEVVLMTGHATVELARRALLRGAVDLLTKPFSPERDLVPLLQRLLAERLEPEPRAERDPGLTSVVGVGAAMEAVLERARKVARSETTVLLCGESGSGKEVIADLIHALSSRADGPLVKVNCAALPAPLLESELFGHRRGAFTGADSDRPGLFEGADGGTLLLDEVGELAVELQAKLLRVLQDGEVRRVGDLEARRVDVRVLAATNRDLPEAVRRGAFRADLYYRLAVVPLPLPPLRARPEDLPALVAHLAGRLAPGVPVRVQAEAMRLLGAYDWPGNVRELSNALEHALTLGDGVRVRVEDLPVALLETRCDAARPEDQQTLQGLEQRCILQALARTGGNRTRAARLLGITRRTLGYRIRKYGLEAQLDRPAAAAEWTPQAASLV